MVLPRRPQRSGCACLSWGLVLLKPHREGMWGQQSERGQGGHWGCGGGLWVGTCIGINWTPEITTGECAAACQPASPRGRCALDAFPEAGHCPAGPVDLTGLWPSSFPLALPCLLLRTEVPC